MNNKHCIIITLDKDIKVDYIKETNELIFIGDNINDFKTLEAKFYQAGLTIKQYVKEKENET